MGAEIEMPACVNIEVEIDIQIVAAVEAAAFDTGDQLQRPRARRLNLNVDICPFVSSDGYRNVVGQIERFVKRFIIALQAYIDVVVRTRLEVSGRVYVPRLEPVFKSVKTLVLVLNAISRRNCPT